MRTRLRAAITYANVVATLALVLACGGTAWAASMIGSKQIIDGSIQSVDVANRGIRTSDLALSSVNSAIVANGSLTAADFRAGTILQGPPGPQGAQGPQGDQGPVGPAATNLWAVIRHDPLPAGILRGSGTTGAFVNFTSGRYEIEFTRDISQCSWSATVGSVNADAPPSGGYATTSLASGEADRLMVRTYNTGGSQTQLPVHVAVFC